MSAQRAYVTNSARGEILLAVHSHTCLIAHRPQTPHGTRACGGLCIKPSRSRATTTKDESNYDTDSSVRSQGAITTTPASSSSKQHSHPIQNLYARATRAELAWDLDTAFRLYVEAGSAFLNVSRNLAPARTQEQARQDAARALERAERIKGVKPDVAPVWRDPFALGS